MAGLCAFLCPGLGHLVLGKPISAFLWFVFILAGYFCFIAPGVVLHILSILNAASIDKRQQMRTMSIAMRQSRR